MLIQTARGNLLSPVSQSIRSTLFSDFPDCGKQFLDWRKTGGFRVVAHFDKKVLAAHLVVGRMDRVEV